MVGRSVCRWSRPCSVSLCSPPLSSAMRFSSSRMPRPLAATHSPPPLTLDPHSGKISEAPNIEIVSENRFPVLPSPSPSPSPPFSVYCLLSADLSKTYVGVTSDLQRRIRQHNGEIAGGAKASRSGRPWKIICTVQGFQTYSEASKFEWQWKDVSKRMYVKCPSVEDEIAPRDSSLLDSPLVYKRKRALDRVERSNDWKCLTIEWRLSHEDS